MVTGAGAKFNESTAHADDVPDGSLKFRYGFGCGFVSVEVAHEVFGSPSRLQARLPQLTSPTRPKAACKLEAELLRLRR